MYSSIQSFLQKTAEFYGEKIAISIFEQQQWNTISYIEMNKKAQELARHLIAAGLKRGDRVAILSEPCVEWPLFMYAILLSGGVVIPLDTKISESDLYNIMNHAEPQFLVFAESHINLAIDFKFKITGLRKIFPIKSSFLFAADSNLKLAEAANEELAVICYTSGTSSDPKGVMIRKETLLFEAHALTSIGDNRSDEVVFSILPLNHLFGITAGVMYSMACGSEYNIAHSLLPQDIAFSLQSRKATQMLTVPLLLSLIKRGVEQRVAEKSGWQRALFHFFIFLGKFYLPCFLKKILFNDIHQRLGGSLRRFISGAAALDPSLYDFFKAIGLPIYEGYGLTETGPVIAVNTTRFHKKKSVGRPIPGVKIKIEADGELCTSGPHVLLAYYKNPELTQVSIVNGWFKTGDIAKQDSSGYLYITGRKKSMISLASGKKVFPEEVETVLSRSEDIVDVCVIGLPEDVKGSQGEKVVAVVLPTESLLLQYKHDEKALSEKIEAEVHRLALELGSYKRPQQVIVRKIPFVKTTSQKIRRQVLMDEVLKK